MQTSWWVLHYLYVQVHMLILNRFKSIFLCRGGGFNDPILSVYVWQNSMPVKGLNILFVF